MAQRPARGCLQLQVQQGRRRVRGGILRPGPGTRGTEQREGGALADRYLRRRLVLQAQHPVQDDHDSDPDAGRHRQQEREPAAELPAALRRNARRAEEKIAGRDGGLDAVERRGHLWHAAVEASMAKGRPRSRAAISTRTSYGIQRATSASPRRAARLYAIALAWPQSGKLTIRSAIGPGVSSVRMLGVPDRLTFAHDAGGLIVNLPPSRPCQHAFVLRIDGAAV